MADHGADAQGHEQSLQQSCGQSSGQSLGQSFSSAALYLAGIAGRHLGWRADEFWQATPAELTAMLGLAHAQYGADEVDGARGAAGHMANDISSAMLDRLMKEFPDG